MEEEWSEYHSKSGQTFFLYNKATGEHKWLLGRDEVSTFDVEPVLTVHNLGLIVFIEIENRGNINFVYGIMLENIQISIQNP